MNQAAALAVAGVLLLAAPPAGATSLGEPMNLATLVAKAPVIVTGTVSGVTTGKTGNLPYVQIQILVEDGIRGAAAGSTLTFRQLNLPAPQPAEDGRVYVGALPGMPQFAVAERVLLFLGNGNAQGFATTVGLVQGKFSLSGGNLQNDMQNRGLFRNLGTAGRVLTTPEKAMLATAKGVVSADTFVTFLERGVAGNWWGAPAPAGGTGSGPGGSTGSGDTQAPRRPVVKE